MMKKLIIVLCLLLIFVLAVSGYFLYKSYDYSRPIKSVNNLALFNNYICKKEIKKINENQTSFKVIEVFALNNNRAIIANEFIEFAFSDYDSYSLNCKFMDGINVAEKNDENFYCRIYGEKMESLITDQNGKNKVVNLKTMLDQYEKDGFKCKKSDKIYKK